MTAVETGALSDLSLPPEFPSGAGAVTEAEQQQQQLQEEERSGSMSTLREGASSKPEWMTTSGSFVSGTGSHSQLQHQVCVCGNVFTPDALFCRKCGIRRPSEFQEEDSVPIGRPIWSWSREMDGPRPSFLSQWRPQLTDGRLLDRTGPFFQSKGIWNVPRIGSRNIAKQIRSLYLNDSYHSFLGFSLKVQIFVYTVAYFVVFLLFAPVYLAISEQCGLEIEGKFGKAYYLSLETFVTIGYGVPDHFFNDCWEGTIVLTVQSLVQYFLNAVVIGSLFCRLTQPQARANTILFSDKAVFQTIGGKCYFMFQACETKHHDLLQAHIRCYCIRHDKRGSHAYHSFPMRIQHPDDDQGSMLLMSLPARVVHQIDNWSPLSPACFFNTFGSSRFSGTSGTGLTPVDETAAGGARPVCSEPSFSSLSSWVEVPQRQTDCEQGSRSCYVCPVCGDAFQSLPLLRRHMHYYAQQDPQSGLPKELCHSTWSEAEFTAQGWTLVDEHTSTVEAVVSARAPPTRGEIEDFLAGRYVEIVVIVEGVEPTTSCTLQARHSYVYPSDIVWNMEFADCLSLGTEEQPVSVDLGRFHELLPLSEKAMSSGSSSLPVGPSTFLISDNVPQQGVERTTDKVPAEQAAGGEG